MRIAPFDRRAYTYRIKTAPANLAVSLQTTKIHLKKTTSDEDAIITVYLKSAIDYAEQFTKRDFITRTYITLRDFFPGLSEGYYQFGELPSLGSGSLSSAGGNIGFELRRSPLQSVTGINYFVLGTLAPVASNIFYNTIEHDYSEVLTNDGFEWPENADRRLQVIEIEFLTGFGDGDATSEPDTPPWAIEGILLHTAQLYRNRGDCSCEAGVKQHLPASVRALYLQNRIENL